MGIEHLHFPDELLAPASGMMFCGREKAADTYRWPGLGRGNTEFILWQHTLRGCGALRYEGKDYEVPEGSSMLIHVPHNHVDYKPADREWEFAFVGLRGTEPFRIARSLEREFGPVHQLKKDSEAVSLLLETIRRPELLKDVYMASARAYLLVCALTSEVSENRAVISYPPAIQRALDIVINSPGAPPDVEAMARAAGMARSHFSREFHRAVGQPPGEFVRHYTLKKAASMLKNSLLSTKTVAFESGFSSESAFIRAFRSAFGYTPHRFRQGAKCTPNQQTTLS